MPHENGDKFISKKMIAHFMNPQDMWDMFGLSKNAK